MKDTLLNIIKNGEGISTEFKETNNKLPKSLFETVCAFLNRFGGFIFLGIKDDGSIIGVDKDKLYAENPCVARFYGYITLANCKPYSKNPKIAKVFREIGLADELGSGIRKLTKYTKIYSGGDPILEEASMFETIIPLDDFDVIPQVTPQAEASILGQKEVTPQVALPS